MKGEFRVKRVLNGGLENLDVLISGVPIAWVVGSKFYFRLKVGGIVEISGFRFTLDGGEEVDS